MERVSNRSFFFAYISHLIMKRKEIKEEKCMMLGLAIVFIGLAVMIHFSEKK